MHVVIIGAGQAGVQVAISLRQEGHEGPVTLLGNEPHAPYQRPPLSKAYLKGETTVDQLVLRSNAALEAQGIELLTDRNVQEIDRASHKVKGQSWEMSYDRLVLATGTRPRILAMEGADLPGLFTLRGIEDADRLRSALDTANDVVIIGGGFIGLEAAATARLKGKRVTVLEAGPRVMARAVAPGISAWFETMHRSMETDIRCNAKLIGIEGTQKLSALQLADGKSIPADLALVGIGAIPNTELALAAGLACPNGIETDAQGRTGDPSIYAVGDCAFTPNPYAGGSFRLESVQNAIDQAKTVAAAIMGKPVTYDALPWFWSDQGSAKLQTAGLGIDADKYILRGDPAEDRFTIFHLREGRVIAADSVNMPADHMAARRIIAARVAITPEQLADASQSLKSLLQ